MTISATHDVPTEELRRQLREYLKCLRRAGLTYLPPPAPTEQAALGEDVPTVAEQNEGAVTSVAAIPQVAASVPRHDGARLQPALIPPSAAAGEITFDVLRARVAACTRCRELAESRKQTVFGVGDPNADVLFLGEAPGADEDRIGEPFVGRAGQLLDRIIAACGWKREEIYICNVLKCRPPGNRNPTPVEAANCREYLDGQIALVDPSYIVCWGSVAARNLLGVETPIGRMRGKFYTHGRAKVLCTYHPSYLLRNPAAKRDVWEDMRLLLREMGREPPSR